MDVVHCPQHRTCVAAIQVLFYFLNYCPRFTAVGPTGELILPWQQNSHISVALVQIFVNLLHALRVAHLGCLRILCLSDRHPGTQVLKVVEI